jgi:ADP-heptose:LPS heptosyltransferase
MHLARAVDCPSVIVYGGREPPSLTGYSCNQNVTRTPVCSPCWQRNRCDFDRVCLEDIAAEDVIAAIEHALSAPRTSLAVDYAEL